MRIEYSFGRNTFDNSPRQNSAGSWRDFLAETFLRDDGIRSTKKGQEFVCSAFAKGLTQQHQEHANYWRGKELAQPMAVAFGDFDKFESEQAFDAFVANLEKSGFAAVMHETSSSRQKTEKNPEGFPRARTAILLSREATRDEYAEVQMVLAYKLGALLDRAVLKIEQPIYLPLAGQEVRVFEGQAADVDELLAEYDWLSTTGEVDDAHALSTGYRAGAEATSAAGELIEANTLIRVQQEDSEMTFLELFNAYDDLRHDGANGKGIRCGTPWRDSDSGCAGVFIVHDRTAFIHDVGDGENHYPVEEVFLQCFPEMDAAKAEEFACFPTGEDAKPVVEMGKAELFDTLCKVIGASDQDSLLDAWRMAQSPVPKKGPLVEDFKDYRREKQREARIALGAGRKGIPRAKKLTLEYMMNNFVLLKGPGSVVDLNDPRFAYPRQNMRVACKSSKEGELYTFDIWEESEPRAVDNITFQAGGDVVCYDPEERECINTWKEPDYSTGKAGDASDFVMMVKYLFGDNADAFLDWLADIIKNPGRLPSWGWLHISPITGTGRGWLMSVLARVFKGYTAAGLDLIDVVEKGYTSSLSCKLLAIVEEVRSATCANRYRMEEKLKELVTAPHRKINPKMGKQHLEHNACRWLICSNHLDAIPLSKTDRRFAVAINEAKAFAPEVYSRLYAKLDSEAFIQGVIKLLLERDLSNFLPGVPPVATDDKKRMLSASRSEEVEQAELAYQFWPCSVIRVTDLAVILETEKLVGKYKHAASDGGWVKAETPVRDAEGKLHKCWHKRDFDGALSAELKRGDALLPKDDAFSNARDMLLSLQAKD